MVMGRSLSSSSSTTLSTMPRIQKGNNCFLLLLFLATIVAQAGAQDFYGAQYVNIPPDEARPRQRPPVGYPDLTGGDDEPVLESESASDSEEPRCPGEWQWRCDNYQCIAQYDVCDGVEQCADGSDERHCRGRFGPQQQDPAINPMPTLPLRPSPGGTGIRQQLPSAGPSRPTAKGTTPSATPPTDFLPLKFVLAGALSFMLVAVFAHCVVKRRQQLSDRVKNYRKGKPVNDDEDDFLISQMYS